MIFSKESIKCEWKWKHMYIYSKRYDCLNRKHSKCTCEEFKESTLMLEISAINILWSVEIEN